MAWFFTLFFGVVCFFGIRLLRRGWSARKSDQVGATVKLMLGCVGARVGLTIVLAFD